MRAGLLAVEYRSVCERDWRFFLSQASRYDAERFNRR